jgi:ABC-type sulfate transport system permease component
VFPAGDAGSLVNQAILTKGDPSPMCCSASTTPSCRAPSPRTCSWPTSPRLLTDVPDALELDPEHRVTPIDFGDVCLNYDKEALADTAPPGSLADLADPAYAGLTVVENPATSSPGLAFLLATIAEYGEDGWQDYWRSLVDNGVKVVSDWDTAYYTEFTRYGGDRPIVVSYASSPPAEVIFAEQPLDEAPTGVVEAGCYRQIEFAGVLAGTEHEVGGEGAGRLHAVARVPGAGAAHVVRVPRQRDGGTAPGVRRSHHPPGSACRHRPRRHRRQPGALDRGVDRDRAAMSVPFHRVGGSGRWRLLAAVPPAVFVIALFAYPVGRILLLALGEGGGFAEVFGDRRIRSSLWFTLWQAAASTGLTVVAALPLTWVVSRFDFPGRSLVRAAVTVPFVLPTVVVGVAFAATGMSGSLVAILAAHVFYNLAVVVRTVGGVWSRLDPSLVAAARTMGASPWTAFRTVTAPLLAPALAAASSIVFLFSFTSFGVVLILGGLRYRTLEVEIYQQAMTFLDLPAAGALAVLQLVGVVAVMAVYSRYQETRAVRFRMVPESEALRRPSPVGSGRRSPASWRPPSACS